MRNVSVVLWVFITLVGTERPIPTLPFDTGPQTSLPPNLRTNLLGRLPALYAYNSVFGNVCHSSESDVISVMNGTRMHRVGILTGRHM